MSIIGKTPSLIDLASGAEDEEAADVTGPVVGPVVEPVVVVAFDGAPVEVVPVDEPVVVVVTTGTVVVDGLLPSQIFGVIN
jgi:hypothetical protein